MKKVYIAHPLGSGPAREANRKLASAWVVWAADRVCPMASWIIISGGWDESRREEGLAIDFAQIQVCNEMWLCGTRVSPGMQLEREYADSIKVPAIDLTGKNFKEAALALAIMESNKIVSSCICASTPGDDPSCPEHYPQPRQLDPCPTCGKPKGDARCLACGRE